MSEEKRIEQEIGWYKIVFAVLIVSGLSLLAWFAQNYETAKPTILILGLIAISLIITVIYFINKKVFKCLDRLEEL